MTPITSLARPALLAVALFLSTNAARAQDAAEVARKTCRDGAYAGIVTAATPPTLKKDLSLKILPGAPEAFEHGLVVRFTLEGEDKFGDRLIFPFRCEAYRQPGYAGKPSFNPIYRRAGAPEYAAGYPKAQANSAKWGTGNLMAGRYDEERPQTKPVAGQPLKPSDVLAQSRDLRRPEVRRWADKVDEIEARLLPPAKARCAEIARTQHGIQVDRVVGSKYPMDETLFLVNVHGHRGDTRVSAGCSLSTWDKRADKALPDGQFAVLNFRPNLPHDEDRSFK